MHSSLISRHRNVLIGCNTTVFSQVMFTIQTQCWVFDYDFQTRNWHRFVVHDREDALMFFRTAILHIG